MPAITTQEIELDGRKLPLLTVSQTASPAEIVKSLKLEAFQHVILLFGGAGNLNDAPSGRLKTWLNDGLLTAAVSGNCVIVDGGTAAGVMQLMGEAVREQDFPVPLIGIAPEAKVNYPGASHAGGTALDTNHSHFILVRGSSEWGMETTTLFKVAAELAGNASPVKKEAGQKWIAVLAGGGPVAASEILNAVKNDISIFIITGTGGLADELSAASADPKKTPVDPVIAEIIRKGDLCFYPLADNPELMRITIGRWLNEDKVLQYAWETFANFDYNAGIQQENHKSYQQWILGMGVFIAGLGILWKVAYPKSVPHAEYDGFQWFLYCILIALPIVLTMLIAAANKFKNGMKWIYFRSGAEAIKREIYSYRTRTGPYRFKPAALLTDRVSQIVQKAMKTDINHTYIRKYDKCNGFPPYMTGDKGTDDGFSRLNPESYIEFRLNSQIGFYEEKIEKMNTRLSFFNWSTYVLSGLGTLLAVSEQQVWIALTAAGTAAIGNWLGYQQWDNTISKYNQGAADLRDIVGWWNGLLPAEQLDPENKDRLVIRAEQTLQNEYDGWAQQMQQTLEELTKQQQADQQRRAAATVAAVAPASQQANAGVSPKKPRAAGKKGKQGS